MNDWKKSIDQFVVHNEGKITALLIVIALILLAIAVWGKPHHKAMAMIYIVL